MIFILDCAEIGLPLVLKYVFVELCLGLDNVYLISSIDDVPNTDQSVVFLGDTFRVPNPEQVLKRVPEARYVGWYWHNIDTRGLKFLHVYENMLAGTDHRVAFLQQQKNNCPLLLRAPLNPEFVPELRPEPELDYCYMGTRYAMDLVPGAQYRGIYYSPPTTQQFLPWPRRKEIYLSSRFALGFQSDDNMINKHVSQRIYEGLACGCVVLTNSQPAVEQTNGICIWVGSRADVEEKMAYYMSNPEAYAQKQAEGWAFAKQQGTTTYAREIIWSKLDKIEIEYE